MVDMKNLLIATVLVGLASPAVSEDKAALVEEGKGVMAEFGKTLKDALMLAVAEGGPVNAIGVCNERAPEIATSLSTETGWTIARSSHKLRNPENAADAYTAAAIQDFLSREASGEMAKDLVRAEIVEENSKQVFRLVKAIPTGGLCLNCHGGDSVKPDVVEKLAELYPEDQARGFTEGQMRGVFTLSKTLGE